MDFDSPTGVWNPVSPKLATSRIAVAAVSCGILLVAAIVGAVLLAQLGDSWWLFGAALAVAAVLLFVWVLWWAPRNTRAWGYVEDVDAFAVRGGLLFRRMVVVPYQRMQYVEVNSGPVDRHFGVATLTLHTASTLTAATVPGLPADEATRLRDRLTELAPGIGSHDAGI